MGTAQIVALGAVAGFTIYLGLPVGRMRSTSIRLRTLLNGASAGVLIFLLFDIVGHAGEPLEAAVEERRCAQIVGIGAVYVIGFAAGLLGLLYATRLARLRSARASMGPGAMAVAEPQARALSLGMSIAGGIGLHNFAEGLAIGQTAHSGKISLALLLVVGFGLHNATEGFGIIGPLAIDGVQAPWSWLFVAGLVGGGPTFVGTLVGTSVSSDYVFVAFLALAAGAILYVVTELLDAGRRLSWEFTVWGVLAGFIVSLATEMVLVASGV